MSRKGENIYKRKDGRWEGRYIKARTPQGKAVYGSVYAYTYNEVRKKRSQAVADLVTDPSVPDIVPLQPQSFAKVSGDWLVSIQPKIKESSYIKYTNLLNSYLLPELSQILISELTSNKIQKCCDHLLTHGGAAREGLSAKTVSDILSLLRNILRFAQVQGMRPAATGREIAIRQISPDTVVLSRSSQDILCRYLYSHINERNLGILICLFTGLRIGEICALQWEDISLTEGFIYVHRDYAAASDQWFRQYQNHGKDFYSQKQMFYTNHSSAGKPGAADLQEISGQAGICAGLRRREICGTQSHAELFPLCAGAV